MTPEAITNSLVISDVEMSDMDGVEFLGKCRQHSDFKYLTFFIIPDAPDIGIIGELCELGATNILKKPFSPVQFEGAVLRAISFDSVKEVSYLLMEEKIEQGRFPEAQTLMKENANLSDSRQIIQQGRILMGLKQFDAAERFLVAASEISALPIQIQAVKYLAQLYNEKKEVLKTIQTLERLRELSPNIQERKISLAELLIKVDRKDDAKAVLEEAAKAKKASVEVQKKAAELLLKNGFTVEAGKVLERVIVSNIDDSVLSNEMAIAMSRSGQYALADKSYASLTRAHPHNSEVWYNWGTNYARWALSLDRKDRRREFSLDRAKECFSRSLKENPKLEKAKESLKKISELR
jgi:tetratricopeptide (TPR) repeat protein